MEFPQVTDVDPVVAFLTSEEWPFHVVPKPSPDDIRSQFAAGAFEQAFWIVDGGRLGLVRLMDIDDGTPLFDLRVATSARRRGVGTAAVRWLTGHIFTNYETDRIEGTTRDDNRAMHQVFTRTGYVKEAHYREAWPSTPGTHDAIGYAILRRDWATGTTTPVNWAGA